MSPIVFEINEDKIYKDKCCGESFAMQCYAIKFENGKKNMSLIFTFHNSLYYQIT